MNCMPVIKQKRNHMLKKLSIVLAIGALAAASQVSAQTLVANPTANNGGATGWGIFFDLTAGPSNLFLTSLSTGSTALAGAAFTVEVFARSGSALGGPATSGPGSSPINWASLGSAAATQGAEAGGISLSIDIPDILLISGTTTGVALVFTGAGPRYFGTGTAPLQTFSDSLLTMVTGDVRNVPFSPGGAFFSSRGFVGTLDYAVTPIPEPSTLAFMAFGMAGLLAWRRARPGAATAQQG